MGLWQIYDRNAVTVDVSVGSDYSFRGVVLTMTKEVKEWSVGDYLDKPSACFCTGPEDGQPLCPCMMRGVKIVNGRYVKTEDLGPVK